MNDSKILIWGTGKKANEFLENKTNCTIVGFIETKKNKDFFRDFPVFEPSNINVEYDYIIVASTFSDQIKNECENNHIDPQKVVFLYRGKTTEYLDVIDLKQIIGEANFTLYLNQYGKYRDSFFVNDIQEYNALNSRKTFIIDEKKLWPIIMDKYAKAGTVGNYFWQDLWAAKKIVSSGIKQHFDIGSRLDGFIAHLLSASINVTMIDVREFPTQVDGLNTIVDDATLLTQVKDNSIGSMSALCSLEHFGLGRYGDPIDPEACFKCFANIQRKLKNKGHFYMSVPIGCERVEFNAHRVFYAETIIKEFSELHLVEFSCVSEDGIENNVPIHKYDNDEHNGEYRYGLFHFVK